MNDDNERRLPLPIPAKLIPNDFRNGRFRQETPPKASLRAIRIKGAQLRAAVRNGARSVRGKHLVQTVVWSGDSAPRTETAGQNRRHP